MGQGKDRNTGILKRTMESPKFPKEKYNGPQSSGTTGEISLPSMWLPAQYHHPQIWVLKPKRSRNASRFRLSVFGATGHERSTSSQPECNQRTLRQVLSRDRLTLPNRSCLKRADDGRCTGGTYACPPRPQHCLSDTLQETTSAFRPIKNSSDTVRCWRRC